MTYVMDAKYLKLINFLVLVHRSNIYDRINAWLQTSSPGERINNLLNSSFLYKF